MKIEIISGSPRKNSISFRLALFLKDYLTSNTKNEVGLIDVRDWNLGSNLENIYGDIATADEAIRPLVRRIHQTDAFILVSPEYNGSYSSALKNLLDHFPKQSRKVFGIVTASTGSMGGMRASQQMLLLVAGLFGLACPQMLIVPHVDKKLDEKGRSTDENFDKSASTFIEEFLWLSHVTNTK